MTREEIFETIDKTDESKDSLYKTTVKELVRVMYSYFESRTCESCKYFDIAHPREPAPDVCSLLLGRDGYSITVNPTDYCSKWETKHLGDSDE